MTRRKWTKLRRQLPELFKDFAAWEKLNPWQLKHFKKVSKARIIGVAAAEVLGRECSVAPGRALIINRQPLAPWSEADIAYERLLERADSKHEIWNDDQA